MNILDGSTARLMLQIELKTQLSLSEMAALQT